MPNQAHPSGTEQPPSTDRRPAGSFRRGIVIGAVLSAVFIYLPAGLIVWAVTR